MDIRSQSEVYARLEKAVSGLPKANTPLKRYEQYEMIAIQVLDSEHEDFDEGSLEKCLMEYLQTKAKELGINDLL